MAEGINMSAHWNFFLSCCYWHRSLFRLVIWLMRRVWRVSNRLFTDEMRRGPICLLNIFTALFSPLTHSHYINFHLVGNAMTSVVYNIFPLFFFVRCEANSKTNFGVVVFKRQWLFSFLSDILVHVSFRMFYFYGFIAWFRWRRCFWCPRICIHLGENRNSFSVFGAAVINCCFIFSDEFDQHYRHLHHNYHHDPVGAKWTPNLKSCACYPKLKKNNW